MEPFRVYRGHEAIVEDVAWHTKDPNLFGSVGDDQKLLMYVIIKPFSYNINIRKFVTIYLIFVVGMYVQTEPISQYIQLSLTKVKLIVYHSTHIMSSF
jgi:hypothetical protein